MALSQTMAQFVTGTKREGLEWMNGEEDLLGRIHHFGFGGRSPLAALVGAGSDNSNRHFQLVAGVS